MHHHRKLVARRECSSQNPQPHPKNMSQYDTLQDQDCLKIRMEENATAALLEYSENHTRKENQFIEHEFHQYSTNGQLIRLTPWDIHQCNEQQSSKKSKQLQPIMKENRKKPVHPGSGRRMSSYVKGTVTEKKNNPNQKNTSILANRYHSGDGNLQSALTNKKALSSISHYCDYTSQVKGEQNVTSQFVILEDYISMQAPQSSVFLKDIANSYSENKQNKERRSLMPKPANNLGSQTAANPTLDKQRKHKNISDKENTNAGGQRSYTEGIQLVMCSGSTGKRQTPFIIRRETEETSAIQEDNDSALQQQERETHKSIARLYKQRQNAKSTKNCFSMGVASDMSLNQKDKKENPRLAHNMRVSRSYNMKNKSVVIDEDSLLKAIASQNTNQASAYNEQCQHILFKNKNISIPQHHSNKKILRYGSKALHSVASSLNKNTSNTACLSNPLTKHLFERYNQVMRKKK